MLLRQFVDLVLDVVGRLASRLAVVESLLFQKHRQVVDLLLQLSYQRVPSNQRSNSAPSNMLVEASHQQHVTMALTLVLSEFMARQAHHNTTTPLATDHAHLCTTTALAQQKPNKATVMHRQRFTIDPTQTDNG